METRKIRHHLILLKLLPCREKHPWTSTRTRQLGPGIPVGWLALPTNMVPSLLVRLPMAIAVCGWLPSRVRWVRLAEKLTRGVLRGGGYGAIMHATMHYFLARKELYYEAAAWAALGGQRGPYQQIQNQPSLARSFPPSAKCMLGKGD